MKNKQFSDVFRYYCPDCGAEIDGEYDSTDDTTTCTSCGKVWKVGEGIADSGVDNPGQLNGRLYLVCPICRHENDEDTARLGMGEFVCGNCGHRGSHDGGLE